MRTQIPYFPGFYESVLSSYMDSEMEQEEEETGEDYDEMEKRCDFKACEIAMAKAWLENFCELIGFEMLWVEMWSPREYNFTTDKITAEIPLEQIQRLHNAVHGDPCDQEMRDAFIKIIKEWFTSRSGFIPYYSNDIEEWDEKPLEDMEEVELSVYLAAKLDTMGEDRDSVYGGVSDDLHEVACNNLWKTAFDGERKSEREYRLEEERKEFNRLNPFLPWATNNEKHEDTKPDHGVRLDLPPDTPTSRCCCH